MFRSLIEEKNQILAGLNGYNLSCPALTFLGSPWRYCWPSLPLRLCQEHLGTADKKEPWGRAPWEQCWGHLCAWGTPWIQRASVQGENIQEQPFPPVLWDLPLSSPLQEEVITHPAQIQTGISKHDDVPGRGLLAAEISFQEVSFIIFFCLDNVGAMQVPEENNPGHTALEMKKNEHYIRKMGQNTQKYIRVQWRCWK